jgi:hypothetical protein
MATFERIEKNRQLRGHKFFPENMAEIPALYSTEEVALRDKIIHLHYFIGDCHWYIAELDPATGLAFGYAILHSDFQDSEWGYSNLFEMETLRLSLGDFDSVIERDLDWTQRKFSEVQMPWEAEAHRLLAAAGPLPMEFSEPPFINDKPNLTIVGEVED